MACNQNKARRGYWDLKIFIDDCELIQLRLPTIDQHLLSIPQRSVDIHLVFGFLVVPAITFGDLSETGYSGLLDFWFLIESQRGLGETKLICL